MTCCFGGRKCVEMTANNPTIELRRRFAGLLLGTAVGDALGLPAENLSPERIRRMWGGHWRMRFLCGRGMISDDTEHTSMVAQALLSHPDDPISFQRSLAWDTLVVRGYAWRCRISHGEGMSQTVDWLSSNQVCGRFWRERPGDAERDFGSILCG